MHTEIIDVIPRAARNEFYVMSLKNGRWVVMKGWDHVSWSFPTRASAEAELRKIIKPEPVQQP